ncbi:PREDICTED: transmembrane protein 136-like [Amphimedon queenslandica]|uniref:TLC domain-containing protein n=1 Tax=Amphimedon queenslandica TaxID=400682 RepID=A0A1X7UQB9_AMPQE|nr:PREDICTED: transmembrane protein 136-like [Amphimedon queenslandica]|eukprot:XP_003387091.1 PREDICTED: transmembrane protein 136-like [Amphimedon queenslandica]
MTVDLNVPQEGINIPTSDDLVMKDSSLMGQLPLTAIFTSFFFWANLYFYVCVFNRTCSPEWNCRIVTALHGTVASILSFGSCFVFGPWPFTYIAQPNTQLHTAIITISIGYFIFDFIWCLWYQTEGIVMLAHHVVSLVGFTYSLYTGSYGSELTAVLGGSEVTNPFLQTRWFLKEMQLYKGRTAFIIDTLFFVTYLCFRLGLGTALHYTIQTYPKLDLVPTLGGNAFYIISVVFGVQITLFYVKKYILKTKRIPPP